MDSINIFRRRLDSTKGWLDNFTASHDRKTEPDDFDVVSVVSISSSDFGVESLSSAYSSPADHQDPSSAYSPPTDHEDPSGEAAYHRRQKTCTCSQHSCHKCHYRPGSCDGVCIFCTRSRFALHATPYCEECNGTCYNDKPKHHPDDASTYDDVDNTAFVSSRRELIDYEFTHRDATNTFRDLRSASKARKRKRRESEKYWNYRVVKRGWLGRDVYNMRDSHFATEAAVVLPADAPVEKMTKATMYAEAQWYPRPPRYHRRHIDKIRYPKGGDEGWAGLRKHAVLRLGEEAIDAHAESQFTVKNWICPCCPWGQDFWAAYEEKHWLALMTDDWCDDCDVHWSACDEHQWESFGESRCVVDEVYELRMEKDEKTGGLKVMFEMDLGDVDNRVNRAPAVISYGKRDWVLRPYPEHFTEDDLTL